MIQGSEEWHQARLGKVTASRIVDVMAKGAGGKPSATRANYMAELAAERLTGSVAPGFTSAAMQHGTETEAQARACYAWDTGAEISEVGFIGHPTIAMSGASPDGLIGTDRGLEIKCPNTATHIATLRGAAIKRDYLLQMQWGMACTKRAAWDFVSFDPRMPDEMRMHIRTVEIDGALIAEIETEVSAFLAELDAMVAELRAKYMKEAA
jgi:putative phage-type endonuclease